MSANTGWIHTARRVIPSFFKLSRRTAPTWRLRSIDEIDADALADAGIEALFWDVDGTLMSHHAGSVDSALAARFEALGDDPRFRQAIVSNCQLPRFAELGRMFPGIPVILGFNTPGGSAFRILQHGEEHRIGPGESHLPALGTADPGPEVTPMRKPSGELVEVALETVGLGGQPRKAVMIGDQYFTDIVSANLAGARSIKVPTLDPPSFPAPVRFSQRFETAWVALLRGLGLARNDG